MDSFLDVSYRGLDVGRRLKLIDVGPDAGYLECAAPMPVGSLVSLATDDGITIAAEVRGVHEQVGGTDRAPGMRVAPTLDGAAATWWAARVTLPASPPPTTPAALLRAEASAAAPVPRNTQKMTAAENDTARQAAERARVESGAPPFGGGKKTRELHEGEVKAVVAAAEAADARLGPRGGARPTPTDGIPAPVVDEDGLVDDGRKTEVMAAIDPEILARLTGSGEMPLVDDGKKTVAMDVPSFDEDSNGNGTGDDADDDSDGGNGAPDPAPSASGSLPPARGKGKRGRRGKRR